MTVLSPPLHPIYTDNSRLFRPQCASCIAHETAISCNLPIHSFTGNTKSLTDPPQTNT